MKPMSASYLSDRQLEKLSDITSDIALVALASIAIPAILERPDIFASTLGLFTAFAFWLASLWLLKIK